MYATILPNNTHLRHARQGIGLIEIAMGLGIASLIISAALAYYGMTNETRKTNDVISQRGMITDVVNSMYSNNTYLGEMKTSVIAASGRLPAKYAASGANTIGNAYGGNAWVYGFADHPEYGYDIVFTGLSKTACIQLALPGPNENASLIQMVVNPDGAGDSWGSGGFGSYQLDTATWRAGVLEHCKSGKVNTIRYSLR